MSNEESKIAARAITSGGAAGKLPLREVHSALVSTSLGAEFNVIELDFAPEACVRFDDVRFELDSSFIGPEAKEELKLLGQLHKEDPRRTASVFGHADSTGDVSYNKELSGRRAQAMYGLLTRRTDLWEDLFEHPRDKWGTKSIQIMLTELGHYKGPINGEHDEVTTAAIKEFQGSPQGAGLAPDGDPGQNTRPKLYLAYMDSICIDENNKPFTIDRADGFLAHGADAGGKGDFQGCSDFNPGMVFSEPEERMSRDPANKAERDRQNRINRRVVVYLFRLGSEIKPASWPCPRVKEDDTQCRKRFHADGDFRRTPRGDERRLFHLDGNTFACNFYERISVLSPCEKPPLPPPTVTFIKVQTTSPVPGDPDRTNAVAFHDGNDFSPRLGECANVHIHLDSLTPGVAYTLRIDFGRLTIRPNNANASFTLVSRVEVEVTPVRDNLNVPVKWNGEATVAVGPEFSNRKTFNVNTESEVNIPVAAIQKGKYVPHGLYVIDQITLLQGRREVAMDRPVDVYLSVPILVNLIFNEHFETDLTSFGLEVFRSDIEEALRRFGERDYMTKDPNRRNRINVRFITDSEISHSDSIVSSVGGEDVELAGGETVRKGRFGHTPDLRSLDDNLFVFSEGIGQDIRIFPPTFMAYNLAQTTDSHWDYRTFRAIFGPLGVLPNASVLKPGVAGPRAVARSSVTGRCTDAYDKYYLTVTWDQNGMATVRSNSRAQVPPAREHAIERALRAFVHMVGNTINHETAHALGVVSRVRFNNFIDINGTRLTSPLNGDEGSHNRLTKPTNIMDAAKERSFLRRIEEDGRQQVFNAVNARYLRDCIPFAPPLESVGDADTDTEADPGTDAGILAARG